LLDNKIENIKNDFIQGMEQGYKDHFIRIRNVDDAELYGVPKSFYEDENAKEIFEVADKIKNKVKGDYNRGISNKVYSLIERDLDEFIFKINSDMDDQLFYKPFFKYIDVNDFIDKIDKISNKNVMEFRNAIEYRYRVEIKERDIEELRFLKELQEKLKGNIINKGNKKLSFYIYNVLESSLEKICTKIESSNNLKKWKKKSCLNPKRI